MSSATVPATDAADNLGHEINNISIANNNNFRNISNGDAKTNGVYATPTTTNNNRSTNNNNAADDDEEEEEDERVYLLHIESRGENTVGRRPTKRDVILSVVERDLDEIIDTKSPARTPILTGRDGTTAVIPEAEASVLAESVLHDSFLLDLPEAEIESRLRTIQRELGSDFDIEMCEKAEKLEELLDREYKVHDSAFYLVDLGTVVRKYEQWVTLLPNVKPFYAVKSNPDKAIVKTLKAMGCGFDCASQAELQMVLDMGVAPSDVIFANPCKMNPHLIYAKQHNVTKMTFDNLAELQKIHQLFPEAELILRILPPDASSAVCNFGAKFGADKKTTKSLLKEAKRLGANITGFSFHVGSGCWDPKAYTLALELAHDVYITAKNEHGFNIKYLDIGGGYPAADNQDSVSMPQICETLVPAINRLFPPESGIELIAEPGRYFCGEAVVLAVNVIAKRAKVPAPSTTVDLDDEDEDEAEGEANSRADAEEEEQVLYYLSDGVYGSFNNVMFDHQHPVPQLSAMAKQSAEAHAAPSKKSTLFGPTCDSIDVICRDINLPELEIGSWLYFLNMGAYTMAAASSFNGFSPPPRKYIITPG